MGSGNMWWDKIIFGWSMYHVVLWFLAYSFLGWVVESIYMSICHKKLINRGFAKSPMCPIYGVGALTVYILLQPYSSNPFRMFFLGMILATALELFTAWLMNRIFGEIWWDYNDKPFNYKGVICLESSIAWGMYTLGLFYFLHNLVSAAIEKVPLSLGKILGSILLLIYCVDFSYTFYQEKKENVWEKLDDLRGRFFGIFL